MDPNYISGYHLRQSLPYALCYCSIKGALLTGAGYLYAQTYKINSSAVIQACLIYSLAKSILNLTNAHLASLYNDPLKTCASFNLTSEVFLNLIAIIAARQLGLLGNIGAIACYAWTSLILSERVTFLFPPPDLASFNTY